MYLANYENTLCFCGICSVYCLCIYCYFLYDVIRNILYMCMHHSVSQLSINLSRLYSCDITIYKQCARLPHLATRVKTSREEMATHRVVSMFDWSTKDWMTYTERMKHHFVANDVTDADKKCLILLSACGPTMYKVIRNLVEEGKLDMMPYDDIVKLVKNYYDPLPSVTMQRYKFNTRVRSASESVAALREIAQCYEYKEMLQDMLRDRLVCGVNHEAITYKSFTLRKEANFRQGNGTGSSNRVS